MLVNDVDVTQPVDSHFSSADTDHDARWTCIPAELAAAGLQVRLLDSQQLVRLRSERPVVLLVELPTLKITRRRINVYICHLQALSTS